MTEQDELPHFGGPIVQWPKYAIGYRGEEFVVSPVPTDDGRWLVGINEWSDNEQLYPTVIAAIDAAMELIKRTVDDRLEQSEAEPTSDLDGIGPDGEGSQPDMG